MTYFDHSLIYSWIQDSDYFKYLLKQQYPQGANMRLVFPCTSKTVACHSLYALTLTFNFILLKSRISGRSPADYFEARL